MNQSMNRRTPGSTSGGPLDGWTAQPEWPDDEPATVVPEASRGRLTRIVRALRDAMGVGGMSRYLASTPVRPRRPDRPLGADDLAKKDPDTGRSRRG